MFRIDAFLLAACFAVGTVVNPVNAGAFTPPEPPVDRGWKTSTPARETDPDPSLPPIATLEDEVGERLPYVKVGTILGSLLPAKGITYRPAPPSLELAGLVGGHQTIRYSFDLTIETVQVYFLGKDGQIRSAWFAARFQSDQEPEHIFYDRMRPKPGSLVALTLSGDFVHPDRIDWEGCQAGNELDAEVCWLGGLVEGATLPPLSRTFLTDGYAPGHPRYGFLVGWKIAPLKLETIASQAGGKK